MNRIPIKRGSYCKGVDVSKWQSNIDWKDVKEDPDIHFAIARAAYGTTKDRLFDQNWQKMRDAGVLRGAYQYVTTGSPARHQAEILCQLIQDAGGLSDEDLPPVIDLEVDPKMERWPSKNRLPFVTEWCETVRAILGRVPIIYTSPYYWQNTVTTEPVKYPLWVAHYNTFAPLVPDSWPTWMIWQYTNDGESDGVSTRVDVNIFEGSEGDLRSLTKIMREDVYWEMVGLLDEP